MPHVLRNNSTYLLCRNIVIPILSYAVIFKCAARKKECHHLNQNDAKFCWIMQAGAEKDILRCHLLREYDGSKYDTVKDLRSHHSPT